MAQQMASYLINNNKEQTLIGGAGQTTSNKMMIMLLMQISQKRTNHLKNQGSCLGFLKVL